MVKAIRPAARKQHSGLANVPLADVYVGKGNAILMRWGEIKRLTTGAGHAPPYPAAAVAIAKAWRFL